jgi:predicted nucleic acid-binding protein
VAVSLRSLAELAEGSLVFVDTAPLIYHLEGHATLSAPFSKLFARVAAGEVAAVVSTVTLAELVTGPLAHGDEVLATRYQHMLSDTPGWTLRNIDAEIAVLAARYRLRYKLRLPDALQLSTAVTSGAAALVTHDDDFGSAKEIPILRG